MRHNWQIDRILRWINRVWHVRSSFTAPWVIGSWPEYTIHASVKAHDGWEADLHWVGFRFIVPQPLGSAESRVGQLDGDHLSQHYHLSQHCGVAASKQTLCVKLDPTTKECCTSPHHSWMLICSYCMNCWAHNTHYTSETPSWELSGKLIWVYIYTYSYYITDVGMNTLLHYTVCHTPQCMNTLL